MSIGFTLGSCLSQKSQVKAPSSLPKEASKPKRKTNHKEKPHKKRQKHTNHFLHIPRPTSLKNPPPAALLHQSDAAFPGPPLSTAQVADAEANHVLPGGLYPSSNPPTNEATDQAKSNQKPNPNETRPNHVVKK